MFSIPKTKSAIILIANPTNINITPDNIQVVALLLILFFLLPKFGVSVNVCRQMRIVVLPDHDKTQIILLKDPFFAKFLWS